MPMPDWLRHRRSKAQETEEAALWSKCPKCCEVLYRRDLAANLWVCPKCSHHFRMSAFDRINTLVDSDFTEIGNDVLPGDPLQWTDKKAIPQNWRPIARNRNSPKASCADSARSADTTRRSASWIFISAAARWARSSASASRCCSKARASASFRASFSPRAAAPAWKRACSRSCRWQRPRPPSRV